MKRFRFVQIAGEDAVERDEDGLPVAFRIWRPGPNPTSDGVDVFDESSAAALHAQQDAVGRQFSFDYNHNMFLGNGDPALARAAGYHTIAVRYSDGSQGYDASKTGGELWATECTWTEEARGYIAQDPPLYRYFSPAFECDDSGVITKYLNCALTNIPATYGLPSLRSETANEGTKMDIAQLLAMLGIDPTALDGLDEEGVKALLASKLAPQTNDDAPAADPSTSAQSEGDPEAEKPPVANTKADDIVPAKMAAQARSLVRAVSTPIRNAAPVRTTAGVEGYRPTQSAQFRSSFNLPAVPIEKAPRDFEVVKRGGATELVFLRNEGDRLRHQEIQDAHDRMSRRYGGAV